MLFSLKIAEYVGKGDELWKSMRINLFFMNSLSEVKNAKMQKMHSTIFPHTQARVYNIVCAYLVMFVCVCVYACAYVCACVREALEKVHFCIG